MEENLSNKKEEFKVPKNIRQVGRINSNKQIYIEDYVMSFVRNLGRADSAMPQVAILLGNVNKNDAGNIFIQAAVKVKCENIIEEGFTNDIWSEIYEDIKKYFHELEIVGWFIGGASYYIDNIEKIKKLHVDNFTGQDKVLLTFDNVDDFECFYIFEKNQLAKQKGYYIYYIKNDEMQSYIIDFKEGIREETEVNDRVTREVKTIMHNKKKEEGTKNPSGFMYLATTAMAVVVLMIGGTLLNNYEKMKSIERELASISKNINEFDISKNVEAFNDSNSKAVVNNEKLPVEVLEGEVKPVDEIDKDDSDDKKNAINKKDDERIKDGENKGNAEENTEKKPTNKKPDSNETDKKDNKNENKKPNPSDEKDKGEKNETPQTYKVQSGDTLATISYKIYNTYKKVEKIKEINNIENEDFIVEGQILTLP